MKSRSNGRANAKRQLLDEQQFVDVLFSPGGSSIFDLNEAKLLAFVINRVIFIICYVESLHNVGRNRSRKVYRTIFDSRESSLDREISGNFSLLKILNSFGYFAS